MTEPVAAYSDEQAEQHIRDRCRVILAEFGQLRGYSRPGVHAQPREVHEGMLEVRPLLDRMEYLLAELTGTKAWARIAVREAETAYREAWDQKATEPPRAGYGPEYQGKEERYAVWNLQVLPQLVAQRRAQRLFDYISGVEEQCRLHYRGLSSVQDELKTSLRFLQWESALERT